HEAATRTEDYACVPGWLRECYPRLFAHPRLIDRLRIFAIAYEVRSLLADPPTAPPRHQDPRSGYHRLQHLGRRTSYLDHCPRRQRPTANPRTGPPRAEAPPSAGGTRSRRPERPRPERQRGAGGAEAPPEPPTRAEGGPAAAEPRSGAQGAGAASGRL